MASIIILLIIITAYIIIGYSIGYILGINFTWARRLNGSYPMDTVLLYWPIFLVIGIIHGIARILWSVGGSKWTQDN